MRPKSPSYLYMLTDCEGGSEGGQEFDLTAQKISTSTIMWILTVVNGCISHNPNCRYYCESFDCVLVMLSIIRITLFTPNEYSDKP